MLGIFIGELKEWDKGYGTDSIRTILRYAVDKLKLHKINLHVYEYNLRAIKAYENCGFKKEGLLKEGHYYSGRYWDVIVMGILDRDVKMIFD
jgi:RimJ/RimL family protein N-acetyltransferase